MRRVLRQFVSEGALPALLLAVSALSCGPDINDLDGVEDSGIGLGCEAAVGLEAALFPLEVGRSWQYELQCGSCGHERETRTVTGTRSVHGREAYVLETDFGTGPMESFWTRDGETIAGTFTNCWRVDLVCADPQGQCINRPVTYCPGIGPVRQSSFETYYNLEGCGRSEPDG